ncbi:hypothetical protein BGW80DRAFT_1307735 [Lactifluus volemus]|nr:hypothetical protein BGW80DRAFT_1307735 [Lactifluus volemus]
MSSIRRVVCRSSFLFFVLCIQATPSLCAWRRCAFSEHSFFMIHNPCKQKVVEKKLSLPADRDCLGLGPSGA